MRKLVAPSAPTADDSEAHIASVASDVAECISIVQEEERPRFQRYDQLQETAGAPILVSKCDRDRWIGAAIVPTNGAN